MAAEPAVELIQFDGSEAGQQFITAWKQAGLIVDAGHGIPLPPPRRRPEPTF